MSSPPASHPLVSVIIPVYERQYCVSEAVQSVLEQTHSPLECVVVDDGSTDGSLDVVVTGCAGDPRVRAFAQSHGGVSAARNRGLREARGEYVTFLDSDDLMPPYRIARQLELLAESGCDAVMGRERSSLVGDGSYPHWFQRNPELRSHYWTSVLVATRNADRVGGFDETLRVGEDFDFLARLIGAGLRIHAVDEVFATRRYFGDNLTNSIENPVPGMRDVVRRHLDRRRATGDA